VEEKTRGLTIPDQIKALTFHVDVEELAVVVPYGGRVAMLAKRLTSHLIYWTVFHQRHSPAVYCTFG
jgi:hypothetical protein